jgi:hypothetical protein
MTQEAGSITITSASTGADLAGGLVYSQYYNLIKAPFDAQKVYALQPPVYENLALDPLYLRSLREAGRATIADHATLKRGYLLAKRRAALNLQECTNKSFGIREEHRISLSLFRLIQSEWDSIEPTTSDEPRPLPWFSLSTDDMLLFLRGQINRHCLLFEYILGRSASIFTLAETVPMVVALRGLRYCYSSNAIFKEPLLFQDKFTRREFVPPEVLEQDAQDGDRSLPPGADDRRPRFDERERVGLGISRSMKEHGFGWWLPDRFQWEFWRFHGPFTRRLLVGNLLLHAEYHRRYKAVRNVRNVQIQLLQAQSWFQDHNLPNHPQAQATWLDYLHCLVLRQFDLDIWQEVHSQHKKYAELRPTAASTYVPDNPPTFCWDQMHELFYDRGCGGPAGNPCGPHLATGNKMYFTEPQELVSFLFDWRDKTLRRGWSARNYRVATQRIFTMISHFLSEPAAEAWYRDLKGLVLITRWILPYPSGASMFSFTKTDKAKGLHRRVIWFPSSLYRSLGEDVKWAPSWHLARSPDLGKFINVSTSTNQTCVFRQTYLSDSISRLSQYSQPHLNDRRDPKWTVQQVLGWLHQIEKDDTSSWSVGKVAHQSPEPFIPLTEGGEPPQLVHYQLIKPGLDFDELESWFQRVVDRE